MFIRKIIIVRIKGSKVIEKVLVFKGLNLKEEVFDNGFGILVISLRWCLIVDVKNEKGKINGNILKREEE